MNRCFSLWIFFVLVVSTIVPRSVSASWQPEISVGLVQGAAEVRLASVNGNLHIYEDLEKEPILELSPGIDVTIRLSNNNLWLNSKVLKGERLILQSDVNDLIKVNGISYRGYITVLKKKGLTVVNIVPVEEYLYGVVPKEMPPGWPMEALRAQSVAARTYALKNRKRHSTDGFDLCNTAHCQVYEGAAAETNETTAAVNATRGEVLFYKGTIIDALFHTDSGGITESSENVWGNPVPYLHSVTELQMQTQPWSRKFPTSNFLQKIESNKKSIGNLKEIQLSPLSMGRGRVDRSPSGRVLSAVIIGTKGRISVTGNDLRAIFSLPSTLFSIRYSKSETVFNGYGSGHGLGLSQWGAKAFAEKKKNYKDILLHYYTGVSLEKLY